MSTASPSQAPPRRLAGIVAGLLSAVVVGYALLVHHGVGPTPRQRAPAWYDPSGFLLDMLAAGPFESVGEDLRISLLVLVAPVLALGGAVFALSRAALPRMLCVVSGIAVLLFTFYAVQAPLVWRFFHWRWSGSMALFSLIVGAAATAPILAGRWLRLPSLWRWLLYLPIFAGILVLERDVTGTDPSLPFSVSPWPAVQVFGLDAAASALAALWLGGALALAALRLAFGRQGAARLPLVLLAAALGAGLPPAWLWLGSQAELLSFPVGPRALGAAAAVGGLAFVLAAASVQDHSLSRRARVWGIAGLLVAVPLLLGQLLVRWDYESTRNVRAQELIDGLAGYYAREELYPDRLEDLLETGDLERIRQPRIGFGLLDDPRFHYQSFGTSFILEFSAPRWIQCAYNPPYEDEEEEEEAEEAWSCPSRPPELW